MKKITIDTTIFTEEQILLFAKFRGYNETIQEEQIVTDENGVESTNLVEVPNPQTPVDYISEKAKEVVSNWLSERLIKEAKQQKREEERVAVVNIKASVETAVQVEEV